MSFCISSASRGELGLAAACSSVRNGMKLVGERIDTEPEKKARQSPFIEL